MRVIKHIAWAFAWLAAFVCATWAFGALYFDFPEAGELVAILFVIVLIAAVISRQRVARIRREPNL